VTWTKEEWDEKLKEVPPQPSNPKKWPKGIRPLTLDDEGLGIDADGILYLDTKPVEVRRPIVLLGCERMLATIVAAATVVQAVPSKSRHFSLAPSTGVTRRSKIGRLSRFWMLSLCTPSARSDTSS
jgi:hypothetical protein